MGLLGVMYGKYNKGNLSIYDQVKVINLLCKIK